MIDAKYFKKYRDLLGFTNQNNIKLFFGAKDIMPTVDYDYIATLNDRLFDIIKKIDFIVLPEIRYSNINDFKFKYIDNTFKKLKDNNIIAKLNNQGRRPEEVYFSWMRGFIVSSYFLNAVSFIFDVNVDSINVIGDDDFNDLETFKRTPKADLEIQIKPHLKLRIEVQSGFQGINDIKQHKVLEAIKNKRENNISSIVIHFDFFNGQVAFVKVDDIEENNVNWITRAQMEGQMVFNIDQNYFIWKLTDMPPKYIEFLSI